MRINFRSDPHPPMVGWFDPGQLLRSGTQVLISALLGTRADYRVLESFGGPQPVFDYSTGEEIWIDYVADLGDGWNPTYAIASLLARPRLSIRTDNGHHVTERGRLMIMGGDQVYPTPSRESYQSRLVAPYEAAFPKRECGSEAGRPRVFAIPGNHDWYDGLVSFSRQFCTPRSIGGWYTEQKRSYFAIRLPHRWWLIGMDIQLEADIDQPQIEYFRSILRSEMQHGDRAVLMTAEPHWIDGNIYAEPMQKNLVTIADEIRRAGVQLQIVIAGDYHHYRRHESSVDHPRHLITSGGGGGFLHPTCGERVDAIHLGHGRSRREYTLATEYPSRAECHRLSWRNLGFLFLNPWFGVVTAVSYLMVTWVTWAAAKRPTGVIDFFPPDPFWQSLLTAPQAVLLLLTIVMGFVLFTDTHNRTYRWLAGALHGMAHLAAAFAVAYGAAWLEARYLTSAGLGQRSLFVALAILLGGFVVGPTLMGIYLLISIRVFKRHANESFSSLRIQDYKHFLRMHIDPTGRLRIYAIALDRVPRAWKPNPRERYPRLVPAEGELTPRLIDEVSL